MDRVLRAILRTDLRFFIRKVFATVSPGETYLHNWHVDAVVHQLMRVHSGESRRLLINQPPRSLKSICASVGYVAWLLGHDPRRRVIVASYSGDFAAELHRQFRMVASADWYAALFPDLRWAKETGLELITTQGGSRYATSVGGTLTGRGADLIIVDDPLNANEVYSEPARKRVIGWYGGALVSRLNNKQTGSIIAIMQRLHEDDLAGHLIRQRGWDHLDMPAIALEDEIIELGHNRSHVRRVGDVLHPERESREALEAIKAEVGSLLFSAQYQQRPVPVEGNLMRRSWFKTYDTLPASSSGTKIVQSWDVAMITGGQNDYSACTTWLTHGHDAYLIHVYRGRLEYPDLRRKVIALATEYRATTVLIENAGPGMNLLQDLRDTMPFGMTRPIGVKPEGCKIDRMAAQSAKIEAGHVYLPNSAPWLGEFLTELLSFPNGRHDDQVDSVSQFLRWLQRDSCNEIPLAGPIIITRADAGLPPLITDWSCRR
jgi:predicted phage terminase large subunit-like protein